MHEQDHRELREKIQGQLLLDSQPPVTGWPSQDLTNTLGAVGQVLLAAERGDYASRSMDYGRGVSAVAGRLREAMGRYAPPSDLEPLPEDDLQFYSFSSLAGPVTVKVVHVPTGLQETAKAEGEPPAAAEALSALTHRVRSEGSSPAPPA